MRYLRDQKQQRRYSEALAEISALRDQAGQPERVVPATVWLR